ncbi:HNH endonuclease signature motif containing protein [Novosphingobium sp.]|uniref:HNH endonuclease n=1 Tax=Novosphingobium sp. TaxID=1874826 RepID=UPI0025FB114E|nr:HNH endonuclease signature motif containing protein [Novosphingobium sp.]
MSVVLQAQPDPDAEDFWALRPSLREPIPAIFESATLLSQAADAFLIGDLETAGERIRAANMAEIREWIESLWGGAKQNPDQPLYNRKRAITPELPKLDLTLRHPVRMPNAAEKSIILERDGWTCRYCGIPLIESKARNILRLAMPDALVWGNSNREKHAAFQCMTPEYDHVVPHCYGGASSIENTVICCGPCNCGKFDRLLEHQGLLDPRLRCASRTAWDGLTRLPSP